MTDKELYGHLHEATRPFKDTLDEKFIPAIFKKYSSKKIPLLREFAPSGKDIESVMRNRISRRAYGNSPGFLQLSQLLWHANGFKKLVDGEKFGITYLSTAPSAGSRHPIEIYLIIRGVTSVADGVYHYDIENHSLEVLQEDTISEFKIRRLVLDNEQFSLAPILLIMTAVHERTSWKYGPRGYRFIHLDAGHLGQNIYLMGEALEMSVCGIGGWDDAVGNKLLGIDGKREFILYLMALGNRL